MAMRPDGLKAAEASCTGRQRLAEFAGGAHRAQQGAMKGWRRATRVASRVRRVLINVGVPAAVLEARWIGLCKVSEKQGEEKLTMQEQLATHEEPKMQEEQVT